MFDNYENFELTDPCLLTVLHAMKDGKTCADDLLVVEMLKQLIFDELAFLIELLQHKVRFVGSTFDDQVVVKVRLLRKILHCTSFRHFRPIAVISVLRKVLQGMLIEMSKECFHVQSIRQCAFNIFSRP